MDSTNVEAFSDENMIVGPKSASTNGWLSCLSTCVVVVGTLFIVLNILWTFENCPLPGSSMLKANMAAVAARGRDIYVAITSANVDRETELLPPIWPKTCLVSTNLTDDISGKVFKTSTEYFAALYDEDHVGTEAWKPWVRGFDYSKLAGTGVPAKMGKGKLLAKNNMWLIAANITEEDPDIIPVLITRNVDVKEIERLVNQGGTSSNDTKLAWSSDYKTPFGNKGFVMVRKGGGTFNNQARYATLRVIFNSQTLPPRDPSKPPIVYLMP